MVTTGNTDYGRFGDCLGFIYFMDNMKFTLPLPCSINALYGHRRDGGVYKSDKGKDWVKTALYLIMVQRKGQVKPTGKTYSMVINIYIADKRRHDSSNLLKQLEDVFVEKEIIKDDDLIHEHHIYKDRSDTGSNYLEVEII